MTGWSNPLKFIHTSDWHLGMTRHFLKGEAQARFTQDRIDIITALASIASEQDARFMVVCGDVFDANEVSPQTVQRAAEKLASFPVPVFILPGNHDPLNAASVYDSAVFRQLPEHIRVVRDNAIHTVPGVPGIEVVAAPWHRKQVLTDLCAEMLNSLTAPESGVVRVAMAHGQISTLATDHQHPSTIDQGVVRDALQSGRIHYLALGDRHSVTDCDDSGRIWYSGTPVATDFTENNPNQVLLVDASVGIDPRAQVTPVVTGQWQFEQIHADVERSADIERLEARLSEYSNKERVIIRLALNGALKLDESAALNAMIDNKRGLFASLRLHETLTDLTVLPDTLDIDSLSLSGYARDAWEELAQTAAAGGEAAHKATDALELFYRIAHSQRSA